MECIRANMPTPPPRPTSKLALSSSEAAPEFDVLCLAARSQPEVGQIAIALERDIDWDMLLSLAAVHAVRPQLITAFQKLDWIGVPAKVKRSLLDFLHLHQVRSLFIAGELIRLTGEFSRRAIRFATFKGPSLAAGLYGDLTLREYEDLDLVVEKQHLAQAETVLGSLGYRAVLGNSVFRSAFVAYQRQFVFVRETPNLAVDLHWDFTASYVPFPISGPDIWSDLRAVDIAGHSVPTLGGPILGLFLAGHGAKEGWRRLGWVRDFAMFVEKNRDLDWHSLLDGAERRGCGRSLLLACRLTELLGTRTKIDFQEKSEEHILALETTLNRIRNEIPASSYNLGDFELCENWLQKARALGSLLVTRTVGDYVSMPLPRPFWRIYHVTRPFRLATKAIANLRSGRPQKKPENRHSKQANLK
jgi:Uncharacterised nucleotidyltransferase